MRGSYKLAICAIWFALFCIDSHGQTSSGLDHLFYQFDTDQPIASTKARTMETDMLHKFGIELIEVNEAEKTATILLADDPNRKPEDSFRTRIVQFFEIYSLKVVLMSDQPYDSKLDPLNFYPSNPPTELVTEPNSAR